MGEKIANVLEKLTAVDPDKADRANESLGVALSCRGIESCLSKLGSPSNAAQVPQKM